jgi:uncharacterized protein with HEPN domain
MRELFSYEISKKKLHFSYKGNKKAANRKGLAALYRSVSSNILVYFATMKNVEIVGEAAYMLTKEFKASHPEIPWKQVEGMRHVLVHGYSQVLPRILWATAKENIPEIKAQVEKYLNEIEWEHYCGE